MANPNTLTPFMPELWSRSAQVLHKPTAIYRQIANFRAESDLRYGNAYDRIRPSGGYISNYTRNTDIPNQAAVGTKEQLLVNLERAFRYQIDEFDAKQSIVDVVKVFGENAGKDLRNAIDSDVLFEATNATSLIDDSTLGGSSPAPLSLTGSNVVDAFSTIIEKLAEQNITEIDGLYGVIDPATMQTLVSYSGGRETVAGDSYLRNGVQGDMYSGRMLEFMGIPMYITNNYTRSIVLGLATNPTNGDTLTLTIGGVAVPVQFVSSIGTTAGNVLIGADADATRLNLLGLLTSPTTTSATQVAYTDEQVLSRLQVSTSAVDDATANTLTVYAKGQTLSGASSLTAVADGFVAAEASKHLMFGRRGAIDMVVQSAPDMFIRPEPRNRGMNIMGTALYGIKTFTDGAEQLVQMRVTA